jgi:hypothetical protein
MWMTFEKWKSKPEAQVHPRSAHHLAEEYASAHGYEQSGNSWVLKQ